MKQQIRAILEDVAGLHSPSAWVDDRADLFAAGLTSFATVRVMLAIEEEFGVVMPDAMLRRSTFSSVNALAAAVTSLRETARAA